jgi:superfamily II DNA/RNA helicase
MDSEYQCNRHHFKGLKMKRIINMGGRPNLENLNALFISEHMQQRKRLIKLNEIAIQQMKILQATKTGSRGILK